MRYLSPPRHVVTCAAVIGLVALWTASSHGQLSSAPPSRAMMQDAGLPAIDRGMRDQDPPREPRTAANIAHAHAVSDPYVRGSVIVKFTDAATRGGIDA